MDTLNKEIIKLKIIEQFNQEGSRLSSLMDHYAMTEGHSKRKFICSEFNLCVSVKRINKNNQFQISFIDITDLKEKLPANTIDLSDNDSLAKTEHALEVMDLLEGKIRFSLHKVKLYQENYQFLFDDKGIIDSIYLDFRHNTGRFMTTTYPKLEDFIGKCGGYGKSNIHYHKTLPTKDQIKEIKATDWFKSLTSIAQKELSISLVNARNDSENWFFKMFTESLFQHGNDFMTEDRMRYF